MNGILVHKSRLFQRGRNLTPSGHDGSDWQPNPERRSEVFSLTLRLHCSTVQVHKVPNDCKPKAEPTDCTSGRGVRLSEPVEHERKKTACHATPRIRHHQLGR